MARRSSLALLLLGLLPWWAGAQNDNPNTYTAISARLLTLDFGTPNDLDYDRTFGLDLSVRRQFGGYVALAFPLKIGIIDVGELNNRTMIGVDAQLQVYPFKERGWLAPYLLGGIGVASEDFEESSLQYPLGGGLHIRVGDNSFITGQAEYRLSDNVLRENIQGSLGYTYRISSLDRDRDGIVDSNDDCPDAAGPAATNGCPDGDLDSVADRDDLCPEQAGSPATQGCPDTDGDGLADFEDACPEQAGRLGGCPDQDNDGIADADDKCPTVAGSIANEGCQDTDGDGLHDGKDRCPEQAAPGTSDGCPLLDQDGDGTPDDQDDCPTESGPKATRGCPDQDGDGVVDGEDRCPTVAGPYTGCPDTDGDGLHDADDECPETAGPLTNQGCPEIEREDREVLDYAMQAVQFETGSARLKESSYEILDQIADILERYPDYKLEISGHTDNVGDEDNNLRLSRDRAKACYDFFVQAGIEGTRLSYEGYGENWPRASNETAIGRRRNRRVEFTMKL